MRGTTDYISPFQYTSDDSLLPGVQPARVSYTSRLMAKLDNLTPENKKRDLKSVGSEVKINDFHGSIFNKYRSYIGIK